MPVDFMSVALMLLPGIAGGMVRGLVGISKRAAGEPLHPGKLLLSLLVAAVSGAIASVFAEGDWRMSLLAGYAGSDLLESLYKTRLLGLFR